ncbi:MAG: RNA pyrophosphohydrolase [Actinobacteria bacterium]|nr:MAG: RNA pyrophosphohydrolase [Actinomycetota bacterium]
MASMNFRAGVVAIVINSDLQIMAFERSDVADQWQLPQGGIEPGETPVAAAWRELGEETGLGEPEVELIQEFPEWTIYEWPEGVGPKGKRMGQAQRWFIFHTCSDDVVPTPDGVEFVAWKWVEAHWLVDQIVEFRRSSYEQVLGRTMVNSASTKR